MAEFYAGGRPIQLDFLMEPKPWLPINKYEVATTLYGVRRTVLVETHKSSDGEVGISRYIHDHPKINSLGLKADSVTREQVLLVLVAILQNKVIYDVQSEAWAQNEMIDPSVVKTGITPETIDAGNPGLAERILMDF